MRVEVELRQVRTFLAVAQERNFGRAAERLRIAQSAVSQQIKALERSLGATLLDRTARPIALTRAGEAFLPHAHLIVRSAERAREETSRVVARPRLIIKFGASSFGNGPVIDDLLREARARVTDVDIEVAFDTTAHNVAALERLELDVVMAYVPFDSQTNPRYLRLGTIEYVFAVPSDHRLATAATITRDDLRREPMLFLPRSINPTLADHVSRLLFGRPDHPWIDLSDVGAGRVERVAEGLGITPVAFPIERLVPIPGVVYRRVEDPAPTLEYGLLWLDDEVSPALSAFLDIAREVVDRDLDRERVPIPVAGA